MEARGLEGGGAASSVQILGALLPGLQESAQGEGCPHRPTPGPGCSNARPQRSEQVGAPPTQRLTLLPPTL